MEKQDKPQSPETIVYTPAQVSAMSMAAVDERRKTPGAGIRMHLPDVDKKFLPMRPGELITVLGRPSNYKSGLMQYVARKAAEECDMQAGECVVYVTWEQAIEEMGIVDLAHATGIDAAAIAQGDVRDWDSLMRAAINRGKLPLFVFGHSFARRKSRPRLTLTNVLDALRWLEDTGKFRPRLICLDYLQRILGETGKRSERVMDRRGEMIEAVDASKDMALAMAASTMLGVQAGRQCDERSWKLPWIGDGQETANIEQSSDKMFSVWMPKTSEPAGSTVSEGNSELAVTDNLLILGMPKQKLGPAPAWWPLYVDAAHNEIGCMETKTHSLAHAA